MTEMLTLAWLQAHDACFDARAEFQQLYPGGSAPLVDVVAKLAERPDSAGWFEWLLLRHPALQPHRAAYDAAVQPARAAYAAAVQPHRAAYDAVENPAWGIYDAAIRTTMDVEVARAARVAYEAVENPARVAYKAAWLAAHAAHDAVADDAIRDVVRKLRGEVSAGE